MKKYHVHVYRVLYKVELDVEAVNAVEARKKGLDMVASRMELDAKWPESNYIALSFEEKG
jgi:hypothetical protein